MATILVIDDEPSVRRSLRRILEVDEHTVIEAADGRVGLREQSAEPADLIITDVYMPEMDGIEFLTAHLERHPETPVIAISGGGAADKGFVLKDAGLIGAVATLTKPLSVDQVLATVRRFLPGD